MTLPAPPADPAELADFPSRDLGVAVRLFRIHHYEHEPEWFCNDGKCRFHPPATFADVFGACYTSTDPLGCYIEKFGRLKVIPQSLVDDHRLTEFVLLPPRRIADLTVRRIVGRWHLDAGI